MSQETFEVEIKSLLGNEENAYLFKKRLAEQSEKPVYIKSVSNQLNHYFIGGDKQKLYTRLSKYLKPSARKHMETITKNATELSIRTRQSDGKVKFVIKASLGSDSSANGVVRRELEETVDLTLAQLDKEVLKAGYKYQAKWSRQREELQMGDITVCFDKNAGYGYVVEFEKVLRDKRNLTKARNDILKVMKKLGVEELDQGRLERMFKHYNKNWDRYYGTTNVFTLK